MCDTAQALNFLGILFTIFIFIGLFCCFVDWMDIADGEKNLFQGMFFVIVLVLVSFGMLQVLQMLHPVVC